jgi:hypothetical protein
LCIFRKDNAKTLGIHHGYNIQNDDIWKSIIDKMKNCVHVWKSRNLTYTMEWGFIWEGGYIFCKKNGNIFKFRVDTLEHLHTKYFSLNLMSNLRSQCLPIAFQLSNGSCKIRYRSLILLLSVWKSRNLTYTMEWGFIWEGALIK